MKKAVKRFLDVLIPAALSLVVAWLFILLPLSLSIFNVSQSLREQYDLIDAFTVIRNTRTDVVAKEPFPAPNEAAANVDKEGITAVVRPTPRW